jgi:hypothetical protein
MTPNVIPEDQLSLTVDMLVVRVGMRGARHRNPAPYNVGSTEDEGPAWQRRDLICSNQRPNPDSRSPLYGTKGFLCEIVVHGW